MSGTETGVRSGRHHTRRPASSVFYAISPSRALMVLMRYLRAILAIAVAAWFFIGASLASEVALNPLSPPDTSSPAATLTSFLENSRAAYIFASKARASFISSGRQRLSSDEIALLKQTYTYLNRAIRCLDLSKTPQSVSRMLTPDTRRCNDHQNDYL